MYSDISVLVEVLTFVGEMAHSVRHFIDNGGAHSGAHCVRHFTDEGTSTSTEISEYIYIFYLSS